VPDLIRLFAAILQSFKAALGRLFYFLSWMALANNTPIILRPRLRLLGGFTQLEAKYLNL
jgi:hypothetical protein